jgi:hypothetical protein
MSPQNFQPRGAVRCYRNNTCPPAAVTASNIAAPVAFFISKFFLKQRNPFTWPPRRCKPPDLHKNAFTDSLTGCRCSLIIKKKQNKERVPLIRPPPELHGQLMLLSCPAAAPLALLRPCVCCTRHFCTPPPALCASCLCARYLLGSGPTRTDLNHLSRSSSF